MRELRTMSPSRASLRRHALAGLAVMVLLTGGLGGWAATTQIAGAVVAGGSVVVEGGSKRIQHQEGGIVAEILVANEDRVEVGQLLVRLDGTAIRANLDIVLSQLREALSRQARLLAESTDAATLALSPMAGTWPPDPALEAMLASQDRLRQARAAALDGQLERLDEQAAQQQLQMDGYAAQQAAISRQLESLKAEAEDLDRLLKDGLVEASRVNELKRSIAQLDGEYGRLTADIAGARASIAELQVQRVQATDQFRSDVLEELQTVNQAVAELLQNKIAAEDRLARLEIRAPLAGVVHESAVQTIGGIAAPGETLMLVVPQESRLLVDARVSPLDIDKLHADQPVLVRMSGLDPRTTPELTGRVQGISPDLSRDETTGVQFYLVRVDVPDTELAKLPQGARLVPGMPAEAFIQTGERTVMSYLLQPLADQVSRSFRED